MTVNTASDVLKTAEKPTVTEPNEDCITSCEFLEQTFRGENTLKVKCPALWTNVLLLKGFIN